MIKKILWATDGSKESGYALRYAELFATECGAEIVGVNVIEPVATSGLEVPPKVKEELASLQLGQKKKRLQKVRQELEDLEINDSQLNVRVEIGIPDEEILKAAEEEKADLIIMGKRGLGLIGRTLIGSTTQKVLGKGTIPVLAVKDGHEPGPVAIRSILVPVDIAEKTDAALLYAMDLAEKLNASITALFVLRIENYAYEIPSGVLTQDIMSVLQYLMKLSSLKLSKRVDDAKKRFGILDAEDSKLLIKTEVLNGLSPAVSIVDYAAKQNIDLIVINTHGRKGIKRFIMGSVTEKVIQQSPCGVLVLKP